MPQHSIQAILADPQDLPQILDKLEAAGILSSQIEIISHVPVPGCGAVAGKKSRLGWFALSGALLGAVGGLLLASLTALAYPLPTGGMPILAWWPIGIVTYETTMLGAILSTLVGFLVELRLPRFKPMPYDGAIADGGVLLSITNLEDQTCSQCRSILAAAQARMSDAG
ncbi:MAG: DUF3341 domain-containing protein [Acidobacteria bacterium]|nr:DUF3341 domain-containing protein [Acidobacteriota bacterium]MCI0625115.1 DUF3341 domain-containing protein [Acidobacteriota bacterium]MCI0724527.1 DUF3341 domain-containing protein [Acidobacteriota bacterium]